jgi:general secretion pathway protein K
MKNPQSGIALLVVLWILTILMVMVFSFSVMTRGETYGLRAFKEGMENKFLAEAGINRGILEIIFRSVNQNQSVTLTGKELWRLDGTPYDIPVGSESYRVRIIAETGKIALNSLTDISGIVLKNLLINQGVAPESADIIVDSILDWKDGDDLHRLSGAESDYYMSLPNPYNARNANFETPEELILVRGITPEILYGNGQKKGMINFLSISSATNQISINAAPKEVLLAIPGMDAEMAERIMDLRGVTEIRGADDVREIIGDSYPLMAPYISFSPVDESPAYSIEAIGYKSNQKAGYGIGAVIIFDSPHQYHYLYYKSPADITP